MEMWIAFVLASILILVIPGPTIVLVVGQSIVHGPRSVIPLVSGVLLGDLTAMTCSLLGLGAILSASALLFSFFKLVGALYLVYLGIMLWLRKSGDISLQRCADAETSWSLLRGSFVVTALNPKSIAFFIAFLPQFINYQEPVPLQLIVLGSTFLILAGINGTLYALFGGRLCSAVEKQSVRKWLNRAGGTALVGAGIFTATMKRTGSF